MSKELEYETPTMGRGDNTQPVRVFGLLMLDKLNANNHKAHWRLASNTYLLKRIAEELEELRVAVVMLGQSNAPGSNATLTLQHMRDIGEEAADVANFALMIADNCGALIERNTRPPEAS